MILKQLHMLIVKEKAIFSCHYLIFLKDEERNLGEK